MLLFVGELVQVQTGDYKTLVFRSTRYDMGLKERVPCSVNVAVSDECIHYLDNYTKHIGDTIAIGVNALVTQKGRIFYLTDTDILDITELGV